MNEFGTGYNRAICNRIELVESIATELKNEMQLFRQNPNNGFTDYDHHAVEFSLDKTTEAIECLHQAWLNLKQLLG